MTPFVAILGSGSSGNAAFVSTGTHGLLIDCGLGPRDIGFRLAAVGVKWTDVSAVLLTHTHGDHWNRATFMQLLRYQIPLFAHPEHHAFLDRSSVEHPMLGKRELLRDYRPAVGFGPIPGLTAWPIPVPHDSDPTFAFRLDAANWSVGYASDVGHPTADLANALAGSDVLCVEFNHDESMQKKSRRPAHLIARVLGKTGHLSNKQAADLCRMTVQAGPPGRTQAVVQLHLSRECNTPELARQAGVVPAGGQLWTATQANPCGPIRIRPRTDGSPAPAPPSLPRTAYQPVLPGLN